MTILLHQYIDDVPTEATGRAMVECATALRMGAATLCREAPGAITSTTIICDVVEFEAKYEFRRRHSVDAWLLLRTLHVA